MIIMLKDCRRFITILPYILAGLLIAPPLQAQTQQAVRSETRTTDSGAFIEPPLRMRYPGSPWDYEIRVALPRSYHEAGKSYPILWVTDGSFLFEEAVGTSSTAAGVTEMIVVAIGTPADERDETVSRRFYDFSSADRPLCSSTLPGAALFERECGSLARIGRKGGSAPFLSFLVDRVRPEILKRYRGSNDHTLFGYSAGGNLCLYALLTRPDAFHKYICGSAAPNNANGALFEVEEAYARRHSDLKAKLFLSAGEGEIAQGGIVSAAGIASGTVRMAEILALRRYPSLRLDVRIFPGAVHDGPSRAQALYAGLRAFHTPAP